MYALLKGLIYFIWVNRMTAVFLFAHPITDLCLFIIKLDQVTVRYADHFQYILENVLHFPLFYRILLPGPRTHSCEVRGGAKCRLSLRLLYQKSCALLGFSLVWQFKSKPKAKIPNTMSDANNALWWKWSDATNRNFCGISLMHPTQSMTYRIWVIQSKANQYIKYVPMCVPCINCI